MFLDVILIIPIIAFSFFFGAVIITDIFMKLCTGSVQRRMPWIAYLFWSTVIGTLAMGYLS